MKAWYFSTKDKKLRYGDNRQIRAGITHKVKFPWRDQDGVTWDKPTLCKAGLHGSKRILDALSYAPGAYVWRVDLHGETVVGDDKIVASERTYLWGADASDVLGKFARMCALDVVHLWDAEQSVIDYLKTGDESIRDAAWAAARAAAGDAARAAAGDAARAAARATTRDAARAAAGDAAREKQEKRLYRMVMGLKRTVKRNRSR